MCHCKQTGLKWQSSGVYLPRNRRYQNLLDTVYYEIQAAKVDMGKGGPRESQRDNIGMNILKKTSSLHEVHPAENAAPNVKKRPRLDRQIRQVCNFSQHETKNNSEGHKLYAK